MPNHIVANWEVIIHKNARTSDGGDAGNVVEVEDETLTREGTYCGVCHSEIKRRRI